MTSLTDALDALAPIPDWEGDWPDVLDRAGGNGRLDESPGLGRVARLSPRRALLLAAALVAIIAPLSALAAINHWWFLRATLPRPTQTPTVVAHGSWSGHPWTLVAYPSRGHGLCWGVTFSGQHTPKGYPTMIGVTAGMASHGAADGVGCGSIVGLRHWNTADLPTVTTESLQTSAPGYPSWISGAVVASATHVVVRWSAVRSRPSHYILGSSRESVRAATFAAPIPGYHVRLFAIPLPKQVSRHTRKAWALPDPTSISGTNRQGRVVACFNARIISTNGAYPLSYCKP